MDASKDSDGGAKFACKECREKIILSRTDGVKGAR